MKQKRYNLMIISELAIQKLDSLPERGKGSYVSEAILEKIERENGEKTNVSVAPVVEKAIREIVREEIGRYLRPGNNF